MSDARQEADSLTAMRAGVDARITTEADWARLLDAMARLRDHSWVNVLLATRALPHASRLADVATWNKAGRRVRRGEKALRLVAEPANNRSHADPLQDARVVPLFDVSQTYGRPPGPVQVPDTGQALHRLEAGLAAAGYRVEERGGGAACRPDPARRVVELDASLPAEDRLEHLAHATAHLLLHTTPPSGEGPARGQRSCAGTARVEAASVAYLVMRGLGQNAHKPAIGPVAQWAGSSQRIDPTRIVRATLGRVHGTGRLILGVTDTDPALRAEQSRRLQQVARRSSIAVARTTQIRQTAQVAAVAAVEPARLYELNAAAARYWQAQLASLGGERARRYLSERGLQDAPRGLTVGYAPPGWTNLMDHLRRIGYADSEILAAGLATRTRRDTIVDLYRDRITFAVRDDAGIAGYSARALPDADGRLPEGTPKYLNTPETAVFTKRRLLLGLEETKDLLKDPSTSLVLVEGAADVAAVTAAARNTDDATLAPVAQIGTALTQDHVEVLRRYCAKTPIVTALDPDAAGLDAAARAYGVLRDYPGDLRAAALTADPAETLQRQGPQALLHDLRDTVPLADLVVDSHMAKWAPQSDNAMAMVDAARSTARLIATELRPRDMYRQTTRMAHQYGLRELEAMQYVAEAIHDNGARHSAVHAEPEARTAATTHLPSPTETLAARFDQLRDRLRGDDLPTMYQPDMYETTRHQGHVHTL